MTDKYEWCKNAEMKATMIQADKDDIQRRVDNPLHSEVPERMKELNEEVALLTEWVGLYTSTENCAIGDLSFKAGFIKILAGELASMFNTRN